jgi:hypothetical protein
MSTIKLAPAHHRAEFLGDHLVITIPSRLHWLQLPGLCLWLVLWFVLGTQPLMAVGVIHPFAAILSLFWFAIGFLPLSAVMWQLAGKELLEVSSYSLNIRRQMFGWGWTKAYIASDVEALRVSPRPYPVDGRRHQLKNIWNLSGPLTFDYGAKTYHLGDGVDEAEAKQIVKIILQHFPQYK